MSKPTGEVPNEFEKAAAQSQGESLVGEFWAFLAENKKWWLLPIMIVMMLLQLRQHCCKFGRVCRGRKSFLEGEECNLEHANTGEDCRNFQCWFGH